jgi:hypothetical protein
MSSNFALQGTQPLASVYTHITTAIITHGYNIEQRLSHLRRPILLTLLIVATLIEVGELSEVLFWRELSRTTD